jgi:2-dehydro-3-deoxy-D-arabinonate dehydratase
LQKISEVFSKATSSRCVGPNEEICVRGDSKWSVLEPELAFVLGSDGTIMGFTAGNDVSARDIEGKNPLYLQQAKIYEGCCALGPSTVTVDEVCLELRLEIECEVFRAGNCVFHQSVGARWQHLKNEEKHRRAKVFSVQTQSSSSRYNLPHRNRVVPPDDFSLREEDTVEIRVEKIGTLRNRVRRLARAGAHLELALISPQVLSFSTRTSSGD